MKTASWSLNENQHVQRKQIINQVKLFQNQCIMSRFQSRESLQSTHDHSCYSRQQVPKSKIPNDLRACNKCIRQRWWVHSFTKTLVTKCLVNPLNLIPKVMLIISRYWTRRLLMYVLPFPQCSYQSTGPDWVISSQPSSPVRREGAKPK